MPPTNQINHIEALHLLQVTCFGAAEFEFVPGVNVFVGPNGTGKTHALKLLYAVLRDAWDRLDRPFERHSLDDDLSRLFQVPELNAIRRTSAGPDSETKVTAKFGGVWSSVKLDESGHAKLSPQDRQKFPRPVFVPATDMLAHTRGFLEADRLVTLDFDSTFADLVSLLAVGSKAEPNGAAAALKGLKEVVPGEIEQDDSKRFYLNNDRGRFPMPMVAEGVRKVATLRRLIENNWLVEGSVLFWDEPEVNLNPQIMRAVVEAILMLARSGVQVFLATHSYLILKELEVGRQTGDTLRFFSFQDTEEGVKVTPAETYLDIQPNPIEDEYASLYDRDLQRQIDSISVDGSLEKD